MKQITTEFWNKGNHVVTIQGVELDLHQTMVEVSVLMRNHEEFDERIQVKAEFDTLEEFIEVMVLSSVDELADISLADLLDLYKQGKALVTEQ